MVLVVVVVGVSSSAGMYMVCVLELRRLEEGPSWSEAKYIPLSPVLKDPLVLESDSVGIRKVRVLPSVAEEVMSAVRKTLMAEVNWVEVSHSQFEVEAL